MTAQKKKIFFGDLHRFVNHLCGQVRGKSKTKPAISHQNHFITEIFFHPNAERTLPQLKTMFCMEYTWLGGHLPGLAVLLSCGCDHLCGQTSAQLGISAPRSSCMWPALPPSHPLGAGQPVLTWPSSSPTACHPRPALLPLWPPPGQPGCLVSLPESAEASASFSLKHLWPLINVPFK